MSPTTPWHAHHFFLLFAGFLVLAFGYGKGQNAARMELAQMNAASAKRAVR